MGIALAIAAVAITATVATDVGFGIAEGKKQEELKSAIKNAKSAIDRANQFYREVYKIVKTRLEHLKQSMRKLPPDVIDKINEDLRLNLNDPDKVINEVASVFGMAQNVTALTELVANSLTITGLAAADGVVAEIATVAGEVSAVFAVVGFGLSLYNGIKTLDKLNEAIDKVNKKKKEAEDAMQKMKTSLDGLMKTLGISIGSYETLRDISNDWAQLAENFHKYSLAFYYAMTGFAMGKKQRDVVSFLQSKGSVPLKDDVLALALLMEQNILQMMKDGKNDEQIINFYAKENPKEGLRFVMDPFFVSTLREFSK